MDALQLQIQNGNTYLTHGYHPYPCKFIPQLPRSIINKYTKQGDWVLDPFSGSGTTLVESTILGRNGVGIDLNPVAALSTKVKTTALKESDIDQIRSIMEKITLINRDYENEVKQYFDPNLIPKFKNLNHWFKLDAIIELAVLKKLINELDYEARDFLLLAFSNIILQVSNQDSETRYVAVNKEFQKGQAFDLFCKKVSEMILRNEEYKKARTKSVIKVYCSDSRNMSEVEDESIDLILTSPPYINTFDYYLYHKLRILWLGFNPSMVRKFEMGCHHTTKNFEDAYGKYKNDLDTLFINSYKKLNEKGIFSIVIGDGIVDKQKLDSIEMIREVAKSNNFRIIDIITQSLKETTRSFNAKFSKEGKNEYIINLSKC